ncbi:MAG TPA: PP2C family serine/threonine-protein phosphatase [Streptosporangiaceae bacterium]|nr:PP2C family serine/threonine-protein phosphatase [Streptosporangiaceae bacterium]
MTLALRYAVRSDVGLLREGNEDSAYAGPRLLAVADGMGGHAAGEVASAVTIGALSELDRRPPGPDMRAELSSAVAAANMRLQQIVMANPAVEGMGTTLTAVLWSPDGHAAVCHIGDSRGYLLRDGELYQITHDHTLVQSLIDEGRITEDDASTHPQRSLILRAIDGRTVAEPDLSEHEARAGDRYLICSDGLSSVVSAETLRDTLAGTQDPEACCRQLIDLALRGGGPDNITCIVADVVDPASTRMPPPKPVLAGAAANGTDPRVGSSPATGPFATRAFRPPAQTAPQPALPDDDTPAATAGPAANGVSGPSGTGPQATTAAAQAAAPRGRRRKVRHTRRRWPIVTTALVVLVAVVVVGGYVGYQYTQRQYYVASDKSGHVVIFKGVNQSLLGIGLSHPYTDSDIPVNQVPSGYQQPLANTITASNLGQAQQIVATIRDQVSKCSTYYHQAAAWQTANVKYQQELATAHKAKRPTTNIQGPGAKPMPPQEFSCQPSTAYGVPAASLPGS